MPPLPPVILASGSPRRKELLASLGLPFTVVKSDVDEAAIPVDHLSPEEIVQRLSAAKAQAVAATQPSALVIGSDTLVVLEGDIFGKPNTPKEAFQMLSRLQNQTHTVYSGITLIDTRQEKTVSGHLATQVTMKAMSEDEIWDYIQTQEPMDKAGAYAIQGFGSLLIEKIDGCYFNVVGMSLFLLNQLIEQLGYSLRQIPTP